MMAQAFARSTADDCMFFCSGVSNSRETSKVEFIREVELFKKTITNKTVIQVQYELCDGGSDQYSNIDFLESILPNDDLIMQGSYNQELIKKYSKEIESLLLGDQLKK